MATFEFFGSLADRLIENFALPEFDRGVYTAALADAEEYWTRARDDLKSALPEQMDIANRSFGEQEARYRELLGDGQQINPGEQVLGVWSCGEQLGYAD